MQRVEIVLYVRAAHFKVMICVCTYCYRIGLRVERLGENPNSPGPQYHHELGLKITFQIGHTVALILKLASRTRQQITHLSRNPIFCTCCKFPNTLVTVCAPDSCFHRLLKCSHNALLRAAGEAEVRFGSPQI